MALISCNKVKLGLRRTKEGKRGLMCVCVCVCVEGGLKGQMDSCCFAKGETFTY